MFLKWPGAKKSPSKPSHYSGSHAFKSNAEHGIHPSWLIILTSIWLATLGNLALWQELVRLPEMKDLWALWFCISFALLIACLICIVLSLLCWRWTLKAVISVFLITSSVGSYFMLSYGVVIDSTMMTNVMQTDLHESRDLISWKLLLVVLVFAVLPILWLWRRHVRRLPIVRHVLHNAILFTAGCALSVMVVVLNYQNFASTMRNNFQLRFLINPLNSFYALSDVALQPLQHNASAMVPLGLDAKLGASYALSLIHI